MIENLDRRDDLGAIEDVDNPGFVTRSMTSALKLDGDRGNRVSDFRNCFRYSSSRYAA